jgi:hypothetical protein
MSHLVLQFPCNGAFQAAVDYHEQRSRQRAAQQRAQALHVPHLLTTPQQTEDADEQQQSWHARRRSEAAAFQYSAAAQICDYTFTDTWDSSEITSLLVDETAQQHLQANLQPSKFRQQPAGPTTADAAAIMRLLVGDSVAAQLLRTSCLEPYAFPPPTHKVSSCMHRHCMLLDSERFRRPKHSHFASSDCSCHCCAQHEACILEKMGALDPEAVALADIMQSCRADDLSQARTSVYHSAHLSSWSYFIGRRSGLSSLYSIPG